MTPGRVVSAVGCAWLVICATGMGANQVTPQQPVPTPSFRAGTTVVEVDAIVTGRDGKFVEGLLPDDFEVLEEGVLQTIQTMYVVQGNVVTPITIGTASRGDIGTGARSDVRPPQAGPAAAPPRVFVLFFDQEHLNQSSYKQVQTAAETFLKTQFQQGDIGGVLVGSTMIGNKLTADRETLIAAVRSVKLSATAGQRRNDLQDWPRMSEVEAIRIALYGDRDMLDQVVRRAFREGVEGGGKADVTANVQEKARYIVNQIAPAAGRTLTTLGTLVTGLGRLPGRKTVMFITEGFMFEQSWGELRQIVGLAARSNVRIYSLDALGLRRRDSTTDLSVMQPLETGASIPGDVYDTVQEGPNTLAIDTGGYVIRGTNNFAGALAEIANDSSHYYVLGYSPANPVRDGKFHRITVRVKRPGAQVRARRGYLAVPPAAPPKVPSEPVSSPAPAATPAPAAGAVTPLVPPETRAGNPSTSPAPAGAPPGSVESALPPLTAAALPLRPDTNTRLKELASRVTGSEAAKSLASEGWDRYAKGDLEGAERLLAQAVALPGASPWASYALGFAQLGLRKPNDAGQSWERVRAAVPEFQAVYLDLAYAYLQQGNDGRAVTVLREADERWPDNVEVLNALGTIQVRRGAVNDALDTFGRAVAASPADGLGHFNLARTYELRYYQMRRVSRPGSEWVDNPADLKKAIEQYEAYVALGGPFEADARAAIERLRWIK